MISKLKQLREDHEDGFTLIELLVVILIIGILASIAIPVFLNQRKTANDSAVESDIANAKTAVETWIAGQKGGNPTIDAGVVDYLNSEIKVTDGVTIGVKGSANGYCITGAHENGKNFVPESPQTYDSVEGGMGKKGVACDGETTLPDNGGGEIVIPTGAKFGMNDAYNGLATEMLVSFTNGGLGVLNATFTMADGSDVIGGVNVEAKGYTCTNGQTYNFGSNTMIYQAGSPSAVKSVTVAIGAEVDNPYGAINLQPFDASCEVASVDLVPASFMFRGWRFNDAFTAYPSN